MLNDTKFGIGDDKQSVRYYELLSNYMNLLQVRMDYLNRLYKFRVSPMNHYVCRAEEGYIPLQL